MRRVEPAHLAARAWAESLEVRRLLSTADLSAAVSGGPSAGPGQSVTYTVRATNSGPDAAQNVVLTDVLPDGMGFVSVSQIKGPAFTTSSPGTGNSGSVALSMATLPANTSAVFTLTARVQPSVANGTTLTDSTSVTSDSSDPNNANNSASTNTLVRSQGDVGVTLSAPSSAPAGSTVQYTATVQDFSTSPLDNVVLTLTLPPGTVAGEGAWVSGPVFTFVPPTAPGGPFTATIASLPAGTPAVMTFTAQTDPSAAAGTTLSATASVSGDFLDVNPGNNSASVTTALSSQAALSVSSPPAPSFVPLNDVTFGVDATNSGPSDAQNVVVTLDPPPAGVNIVSVTQDSGPAATITIPPGGGPITASIPTLPAGATAHFSIATHATDPLANSSFTVPLSIASTTPAAPGGVVHASLQYLLVTQPPTVTIQSTPQAVAGTVAPFEVEITPPGTRPYPDANLRLTLPAGTSLASVFWEYGTKPGALPPAGATGTIDLPLHLSGDSFSGFALRLNVDPSMGDGSALTVTGQITPSASDLTPIGAPAVFTANVVAQSDLAAAIDGPATITAGTNGTYTLTVTNNGPSDAKNVVLSDVLPAGMSFVSLTQTSGPTFTLSPNDAAGSIATLPANSSVTFTLVAAAAPDLLAGGNVTNSVTVNSSSPDFSQNDNTATVTSTIDARADLAVSLVGPAPTASGEDQSFTVTVQNNGPSDAQNVSLVNAMLTPASFLSATQTSGPTFVLTTPPVGQQGSVTGTIPVLHSGESATFTLVYRFDHGAPSLNLKSTVSSSTPDPSSANNGANVTGSLTDLAIDLSGPQGWLAGTRNFFSVDVSRIVGAFAGGTILYTLPDGAAVTDVRVNGNGQTGWTYTPAPDGTGGTLTMPVYSVNNVFQSAQIVETLLPSIPEGASLVHTATLVTPIIDINPSNNTSSLTTTIFNQSDVSLAMSGPPTIVAGTNASYTLTVTNNGPSDAHGVNLSDLLPAGMTFVSLRQTSGAYFVLATPAVGGSGTIRASADTLPIGASASFTLVAAAASSLGDGVTISNTANASLATLESKPGDNSVTVTSTVATQADLNMRVSFGPTVANGDASVLGTWVIVENDGPSDAYNVSWSDTGAPGARFVSANKSYAPGSDVITPAQGEVGHVSGTIPLLRSGQSSAVLIFYQFPVDAQGVLTYSDSAKVSADTADPQISNNSASASGTVLPPPTADLAAGITAQDTFWLAGMRDAFQLTVTDRENMGNFTYPTFPNVNLSLAIPTGATPVGIQFPNSAGTLPTYQYTPGPDGTGGTLVFTYAYFRLQSPLPLVTEYLSPSVPDGTPLTQTLTVSTTAPDATLANNTASTTTTSSTGADISTVMTGPATVVAGTNATYGITVTNNGPSDAQGVSISDLLPAGMKFVSLTQTSGPAAVWGTNSETATIATLPANASATFTLTASADSNLPAGGTLVNSITARSQTLEGNPNDNTATVSSAIQLQADLAVSVVGPPPTASGEDQSFTVTIQNNGPSDAQSVSLVNTMTTAASFLSATQTGGPAFVLTTPAVGQQGNVTGSIPVLHSGESATFVLVYRFDRSAPTFNLKATASSPAGDPVTLNNTASATGLLTDLAVDISEPLGWLAGTRNYITVDVTSAFGSAPGATVLYTIPQGVKVLDSTGWTPGPDGTGGTLILGAGSVQILEILAASVPEGTQLVHTATLQVPIIDVDPSNNTSTLTTTVFNQSDVSLAMSGPPTIVPGTNASYTFTVTNKGPSDAHGVSLSDLLPAGMTFVSLTQTSGARFVLTTPAVGGTGTITANAATLPAGASATFTLVTAVAPSLADGSTVNNTANVTLASREGNPSDNTATVTSTVKAQADLSVSVHSDPLVAGGYANFYFTITNSGPSDAASVYLSNNWPTDILAGVQPPTGGPLPPPGLLNLGSLPAGASRQVQIYTYVSPFVPANTAMALTATTYSGQTDSNPANNTFTLTQMSQAISRLSLNVSQTPASEGQQLTYTFSIHNEGPSAIDAKNVNFAFELPEGVQFVSATGSNLVTPAAGGGGIVTAMVPELGYNQFATVTVTVFAPDELNTVSLALVTSDTVPSDPPLIVPTLVSDPPLSILSFGISAVEGQPTVGAVVGTFTDTGVPEDPSDYSATIVWGDGTPSSQGTVTYDPALHVFSVHGNHTYSHEGTYPAILTLNHGTAEGSGADGVATVTDAPLKPFSAGVSGVEGQPLANVAVAQFGDPGGAEALSHYSAMINWGDGVSSPGTITYDGASGHFTVTGSHTYADDGSFPLAVTVNHDTAAPASFSGTAAIADAPITASANNIRSVEGSAYSGTIATFQDGNPSAPAGDFTADIDWGDGTTSVGTVVADGGGKFHVAGNHTYAIDGHFSTQVIVSDEGGSTAKVGANADVADASLHAFSKTVSAYHKEFSGVVGQFSDDNTLNRSAAVYSAIVNWGDGDLSVGTISYDVATGRWNVSGSHRWTKHGTYNLTIVVLDKGGQGTVIHSTALVPNSGNDGDGLPGNNK